MVGMYSVMESNEKRITALACVAIAVISFCGCEQHTSIPTASSGNAMFLGNAQHQRVSKADPFTNIELRWKFETKGAIRGSVAINANALYFGSADGYLYALDKKTGVEIWKYKTSGPVISTPAIYKDQVIFSSRDHYVYSVGMNTGKLNWKIETGSADVHKWGWDYFVSSPTVVGDNVFFGAEDGCVYSVRAENGDQNWKFKTDGRIRATPAVKDGVLYVGSFDSYLYALSTETGELKWKFPTDGLQLNSDSSGWDRNSIDSSPAIDDTVLVFGSRDGNVYALNTENGKLNWKFSYGPTWALSSPAIYNGTVYIGWSDNFLFSAIDLKSGQEKWKYNCKHYVYSSPAITDSIVYVGSHDRSFYAFHAKSGKKVWQYKTEGSILSSPVIEDDLIYMGSDDGHLYAFGRSNKPVLQRAVYSVYAPAKYYPVDPRLTAYLFYSGYQTLDTVSLAGFMRKQIEDEQPSVIVFATDRLPLDVVEDTNGESLIKKYLKANGRVIWLGAIPNLYQYSRGEIVGEDSRMAEDLLDIKFDATHDWGSYNVRATEKGIQLGIPEWWIGPYSINSQNKVTVLAVNELNRPTAWIKSFTADSLNGFIQLRLWDVGRTARDSELDYIRKVAEFSYP